MSGQSDIERNKELIRREVEEAWNEGDLDVIDELFAADSIDHVPLVPIEVRGPEGHKQMIRALRSTFPDLELTIEQLVAEGELVTHRFTMRGTHDGDFIGVEPTGNEMSSSGIVISRIENGAIVESWTVVDALSILQQIGATPTLEDLQTSGRYFPDQADGADGLNQD